MTKAASARSERPPADRTRLQLLSQGIRNHKFAIAGLAAAIAGVAIAYNQYKVGAKALELAPDLKWTELPRVLLHIKPPENVLWNRIPGTNGTVGGPYFRHGDFVW